MTVIFDRNDIPSHLFAVAELDFSDDICSKRLTGSWFRLGAWTISRERDKRNVEEEIFRQSLLITPQKFAETFERLESIGNVLRGLGKPGGSISQRTGYSYSAFHDFELPFTSATAEPLVFLIEDTSKVRLFINPDLWLSLELEERTDCSGIWWDPRRGLDVLVHRVIEDGKLEIVEIRVEYLLKYLQVRQISLLVGHYRQLLFFDPPQSAIDSFVKGEMTLGSLDRRAKALLQNWGLRNEEPRQRFLQRRLHLWIEIAAPPIDVDDPWTTQPTFDPYTFTLPTHVGSVAPARWSHFRQRDGCSFEGEVCDFLDHVYFRQEVLTKYEGTAGFEVKDNGAVTCYYWGLQRSTFRVGNELLATAIGDFAEGVPYEEWPHWQQYAVDPPTAETSRALVQEQSVPEAVNIIVSSLEELSATFAVITGTLGLRNEERLWDGSLDSLAGRQLKWTYPATANDDEFLKRATLLSTLVIDALKPASLRRTLKGFGNKLHLNYDEPAKSLSSRNLLQRLALIAILIRSLEPNMSEIPTLVRLAERDSDNATDVETKGELRRYYKRVREEFAPLAFLYDLRTFGGLAHAPNQDQVSKAATQLGLPPKNWHRTHYLRLLSLVGNSINEITRHLDIASEVIERG